MFQRCFFITGTDTGIGKTTVSCAIAATLAGRGIRVGVMKPIETGCQADRAGDLVGADAVRLKYFSRCAEPLERICPIRLHAPLAPYVAADREGRVIDLDSLRDVLGSVAERHDVTLVEGAGGLLVPVADGTTFVDLARAWSLPVLVVVGNRLGALNHAQLTMRVAQQEKLEVVGYVINSLTPESDLTSRTNVDCLADLLGPALGVFPWLGSIECSPEDRDRLARAAESTLDLSRLL